MLYTPERHVTLPPSAWDAERVNTWLREWSAATLEVWSREGSWPVHPRDAEDCEGETTPVHTQYFGAAGVWIALRRVASAGYCRLPTSLAEVFTELDARYLRSPDLGARTPSWFLGESGLLTARWLAAPDEATADRLAVIIHDNCENPTREALWGAPGTMVAALFLHEATGDPRWAALFRESADAIWAQWFLDEATGVWIWEQDLYGSKVRYFGAGHGWAGNLYSLWRGRGLLAVEQQIQLRERTLQGLSAMAESDGELVNWPVMIGRPGPSLVQWCHGAPGIITSLRHADLPEAVPLLIKAANLIVAAGPLSKGVGACHGTDGNAAALLEMVRRTGDVAWLVHARQFAMWAIDQSEATRAQYGQRRQSLWTGDAGLACCLLDCLEGKSRGMPGLDSFW